MRFRTLLESKNTPYVKPHIEKGQTEQSGWKASNQHGRVKYFGMDFKDAAHKHAGIANEEVLDESSWARPKEHPSIEQIKDRLSLATERRKMKNSYHKSTRGDAEMKLERQLSDLRTKHAAWKAPTTESLDEEFKKGQLVFLKTRAFPNSPAAGKVHSVTDTHVHIKHVNGIYKAGKNNVTADRSESFLGKYGPKNESVEQLDELSDRVMTRYLDRAASDRGKAEKVNDTKKLGKRDRGLNRLLNPVCKIKGDVVRESFINHREYASAGLMHSSMASGMKPGHDVDYYLPHTGDKHSGRVVSNNGTHVHIKSDKDGMAAKGPVHKFKISDALSEDTMNELSKNTLRSYVSKTFHQVIGEEFVDMNEEIKNWKHAGRDIMKARSAASNGAKNVHLVRAKKDGSESKMSDAKSYHSSEQEARDHHAYMVKVNPNSKIKHILKVFDTDPSKRKTELLEGLDESKTFKDNKYGSDKAKSRELWKKISRKKKESSHSRIGEDVLDEAMKLDKVNIVHHTDHPEAKKFAKEYVAANKGDYSTTGSTDKDEKASNDFHNKYDRKTTRAGFAGSGTHIYTHKETGKSFEVDKTPNGKTFYGTDHHISHLDESVNEVVKDQKAMITALNNRTTRQILNNKKKINLQWRAGKDSEDTNT